MVVLWGICVALVVFMALVTIHELGHFLAAKAFGVKVKEFGVGIPPKAKTLFTDKSGTSYTLNWVPLGGFVRLKGEDPSEQGKHEKDSIVNKPLWQQSIIVLAGVFANFLLAIVLLAILFGIGTQPLVIQIRENAPDSMLSKISFESYLFRSHETQQDAIESGDITQEPGLNLAPIPGSIAMKSGIQDGDILLDVGGQQVNEVQQLIDILGSEDRPYTFRVQQGDATKEIAITPSDGKIGAYISPRFTLKQYETDLLGSLYYGFAETKNQSLLTLKVLGYMLSTLITSEDEAAKKEAIDNVGGPIAIGNMFVDFVDRGFDVRIFLVLCALISISLAIFNLLPIPALDGGRFFVILMNAIGRGLFKRDMLGLQAENAIHFFGFMALLILAGLIAYKDILSIL